MHVHGQYSRCRLCWAGGDQAPSAAKVSTRVADIFKQMSSAGPASPAIPSQRHTAASGQIIQQDLKTADLPGQSPSTSSSPPHGLPRPAGNQLDHGHPQKLKSIFKQSSKLGNGDGHASTADPNSSTPRHSKDKLSSTDGCSSIPASQKAAAAVAADAGSSRTMLAPHNPSKPEQGLRRGFFGKPPKKAAAQQKAPSKPSEPPSATYQPSTSFKPSPALMAASSASNPTTKDSARPPSASPSASKFMPYVSPASISDTAAAAFSGTVVERPAAQSPSSSERAAMPPGEQSFEELVHAFHTGQLDNNTVPPASNQGLPPAPSRQLRQPLQQNNNLAQNMVSRQQPLEKAAPGPAGGQPAMRAAPDEQEGSAVQEQPVLKVSRFKQRRAAGIQI